MACVIAACQLPSGGPAVVNTDRILTADQEPGSWLTHGRTYGEQRFSPLTTVNAETVSRLGLAWSYELSTTRGASATPLVVDGVMYVTSSWSVVYALDAKTGQQIWVYDPTIDRAVGGSACCDVVNRGVAVYEDKVFVGALDGRLIALNRADGTVAWEKETVDKTLPYTITGAPRVVNGLVYIGNGGAEYGVRGYVSAYDVVTGNMRWRFYTVPGNPADGPDRAASDTVMGRAAATWTGEWWTLGGGGTVWDAIVYDPDFDQLLIGVGNGSPWNQQIRSPGGGDNLFLSSIVALDARTGVYKWHYQTTPGDTWDFTATQPIILADLTIDGAARKVAMQAPKNGFFYVIDRRTGQFVSAAPLLPMPRSAETPPGAPIAWAHTVNPVSARPVENPEARYVDRTTLVRPSPFGVHNWHPMSFSPATGLVYIPVQEVASSWTTDPQFTIRRGRWNTGTLTAPFPDAPAVREAIRHASKGYLIAWNPATQSEAWRVEHRGPWNGGTLATAGGLVFQGTVDGRFLALDAATGRQLWEYDNQIATLAGPISYEIDGEQYVAVLAGYGSVLYLTSGVLLPEPGASVNGRVYVYTLGGGGERPIISKPRQPIPPPPAIDASDADVELGARLYAGFCSVCHGAAAVSGGAITDLRRTRRLHDEDRWRDAVMNGIATFPAMPRMGAVLTRDEADAIRAYVVRQAAMAATAENVTP